MPRLSDPLRAFFFARRGLPAVDESSRSCPYWDTSPTADMRDRPLRGNRHRVGTRWFWPCRLQLGSDPTGNFGHVDGRGVWTTPHTFDPTGPCPNGPIRGTVPCGSTVTDSAQRPQANDQLVTGARRAPAGSPTARRS